MVAVENEQFPKKIKYKEKVIERILDNVLAQKNDKRYTDERETIASC